MSKKIIRKYIYNINFLSSYLKQNVNIDLIALSDTDLKKVFLNIYGANAELISINNKSIKTQKNV